MTEATGAAKVATVCTQEVPPPIYLAPSINIFQEANDASTTTDLLTGVAEIFHNAPSTDATNVAPV